MLIALDARVALAERVVCRVVVIIVRSVTVGSRIRSFLLLRSSPAPLSLCSLESFDLKDDSRLCPVERRALKDFYHSVKGAEWTDAENWVSEYEVTCNWKGITCNENLTIIGLNLTHNSLSGKLSSSISELRSLEILDLSDNDIQVSERRCS